MSEFFRGPVYVSEEKKNLWQQRIRTAVALCDLLERASVEKGIRPSSLHILSTTELVNLSKWAIDVGLTVTNLEPAFLGEGYSSAARAQGVPGIRCALHKPGLEKQWVSAWESKDHFKIGDLLGYPKCCQEFFNEQWKNKQNIDPTSKIKEWNGPVNPFLKWLGLRLIPHIPCSSNCTSSIIIRNRMVSIAKELGFDWQLEILQNIMNWPLTYSSLHGALIVEAPVLRFCGSAQYESKELIMKRNGVYNDNYTYWEDNGFNSPIMMDLAHSILLKALEKFDFSKVNRIVDLGCGDGTLLNKIKELYPNKKYLGIDIDEGRIARGKDRNKNITLIVEKLEDFEASDTDLIISIPGRWSKQAKYMLCYVYKDQNTRNALIDMCRENQIPTVSEVYIHSELVEACLSERIE